MAETSVASSRKENERNDFIFLPNHWIAGNNDRKKELAKLGKWRVGVNGITFMPRLQVPAVSFGDFLISLPCSCGSFPEDT
jgi:hypothetical protein